ncbi:hypothetical protein BJ165DRAFT_1614449 [Panaeolus papilionaceus]|nr:hypothetical protein BJ165DRAFT_1614449 [Panaeolus papilionaceus]
MGIFEFDTHEWREIAPGDTPRVCSVCGQGAADQGTLAWCHDCQLVPYCSKECQKADWQTHKPSCHELQQTSAFQATTARFLAHPQLCHYLQIAIVIDADFLSIPLSERGETRLTVILNAYTKPSNKNLRATRDYIWEAFHKGHCIPTVEELFQLQHGSFFIHDGEVNQTNHVDSPATLKLWEKARKMQLSSSDKGRINNPVILLAWAWNDKYIVCGLELRAEAFQDAKNRVIHHTRQLRFGGQPTTSLKPERFETDRDKNELLSKINKFIQNDTNNKLGLRTAMTMADRRVILSLMVGALRAAMGC